MAQETTGKHGWVFRNTGLGTLELRNLGTDCSCTIAELGAEGRPGTDKKTVLEVKPGAAEPIDLTWNTRKIEGAYRKSARIGTNDPKRPEIILSVEGEVHPAVVVYPPEGSVDYLIVSNDEEHDRQVAIYSKDRPELKITRLISSNPALLSVDSRPLNPDEAKAFKIASGHSILIKLKKTDNLGAFAEEILAQTDHPLKPEVRIKVRGKIAGAITVIPEKVSIRDVNSSLGGSQDVTLWVRGRETATFTVLKKPKGLDVSVTPTKTTPGTKGSKYKLTVKVLPGTPAGEIEGDILLKTDVPMAGEFHLPVSVLVQSSN